MKKLITFLFVSLSLSISAQYHSMQYETIDGTIYYTGLSGLEITFSDGNMVAKWDSNNLTLPLDQLKSMEFTASDAAVGTLISENTPVEIYGIDGTLRGSFQSLAEAKRSLPEGIYIGVGNDGFTSKFIVK